MQPLEDVIHQLLIPALRGHPPCSKDILALPSRLGGLGILNPSANSQSSFHASVTLVDLIVAQDLNGSVDFDQILEAKKNVRNSKRLREICLASELGSALSPNQKRKITLTKEKRSSSWLTVLPIDEHGFFLNKGEFS